MPSDIEFASLWDTYDLVVSDSSDGYNYEGESSGGENLCSVLDLGWSGEFHCESWGWNVPGGITLGHEELPEQVHHTLWALDEPDDYDKSYEIYFDMTYAGSITPQASNGPWSSDYDDYVINVPSEGVLNVSANFLDGTFENDLSIYEVSTQTYINDLFDLEEGQVVISSDVTEGDYIVEFHGEIEEEDSFSQYFFEVSFEPVSSVLDISDAEINIYPNPAVSDLVIDLGNNSNKKTLVRLIDSKSNIVFESSGISPIHINVSNIAAGFYTVELSSLGVVIDVLPVVIN
jgi:hypothetical protein